MIELRTSSTNILIVEEFKWFFSTLNLFENETNPIGPLKRISKCSTFYSVHCFVFVFIWWMLNVEKCDFNGFVQHKIGKIHEWDCLRKFWTSSSNVRQLFEYRNLSTLELVVVVRDPAVQWTIPFSNRCSIQWLSIDTGSSLSFQSDSFEEK